MQEIKPAEFVNRARNHHVDIAAVSDVGDDRDRLTAGLGDLGRDAVRIVPVDIGHRDGATTLRESHSGRASDPRTGARYQTSFAVESHCLFSSVRFAHEVLDPALATPH